MRLNLELLPDERMKAIFYNVHKKKFDYMTFYDAHHEHLEKYGRIAACAQGYKSGTVFLKRQNIHVVDLGYNGIGPTINQLDLSGATSIKDALKNHSSIFI